MASEGGDSVKRLESLQKGLVVDCFGFTDFILTTHLADYSRTFST